MNRFSTTFLPVLFLLAPTAAPARAELGDELFKLSVSDPQHRLGQSVAIDGTTALVGAYGLDGQTDAAYVFDALTGQELRKLTANDWAPQDGFGKSVAIHGNVALVGAFWDDDIEDRSGSAYLFDTTTGQQLHKLTASDPAPDSRFGFSVAIDNYVALVHARESAYLFDVTTGQELHKLTAPGGYVGAAFGNTVAIDGNLALVGSPGDNFAGAAFVFDVTTGQQLHKLTANDATMNVDGWLGWSVDLSGNLAMLSRHRSGESGQWSGSAYLFDAMTGQQLAKLVASDAEPDVRFGSSVAIDGNTALVGSLYNDEGGDRSGAAYFFDVSDPMNPVELRKIIPADADEGDQFGRLALDGNLAVIGAYNKDPSGAAYLFSAERDSEPLPGDFNRDGHVNAADYVVWRDSLGALFVQSDYDVWRMNFAASVSNNTAMAQLAVPEPASLVFGAVLTAVGVRFRTRKSFGKCWEADKTFLS